jgi:hypothetical protein
MKVFFTSKIDGEISSFQSYSFQEAVEKTATLDKKWKKKNSEPIPLDFMISNDKGEKLYSGTYVLGSDDTTNIYNHICLKLMQLPMENEQQETERDILLQNLNANTPASYQMDLTELSKQNTVKTNGWKQLSKRVKIFTCTLASLLVVAILSSIVLAIIATSKNNALEEANVEVAEVKAIKTIYEKGITGDVNEAITKLQANEKHSDSEQEVLIHFLLSVKNYKEAVNEKGKENVSILASQIMQLHGIEELKNFQESYPSSAGEFEIAYHTEDYQKAVAIKDVPMTSERYKEKGLAYLNLDNLDEAKKMASEAKSDELNKKITTYEDLDQQLTQLNSQLEEEEKSKDKDEEKIKSIKEQRNAIIEEQNNI